MSISDYDRFQYNLQKPGATFGAVASVNARVGNVQLTAADVGAQPAVHAIGAVHFNGSAKLTRAPMNGVVDSPTGVLSVWLRNTGSDQIFLNNSNADMEFYLSTGNCNVTLYSQDQANSIQYKSGPFVPAQGWVHLLMAWDMNHGPTQRVFHMAVNSVLAGSITTNSGTTPFTVDYSGFPLSVGSNGNNAYLTGDMAEFYFAPGQFLDLTDEANVAKFIDARGYPVPLGENGELPTGTAPAAFFSAKPGSEAATFAVNAGTGGAFALTGPLTAAATAPSDPHDVGFNNPMTGAGELITSGVGGAATHLANPGEGTFTLQSIDGVLTWVAA